MTNVDKKVLSEERKQELRDTYIEMKHDITEDEKLENISLFDQFILETVDRMTVIRRKKNNLACAGVQLKLNQLSHIVKQVDIWVKDMSDDLQQQKVARLQELVNETIFVRDTVIATPDTIGLYEKWKVDAKRRLRDPELRRLELARNRLKSALNRSIPKVLLGNIIENLKQKLVEATASYDSELCYAACSPFDYVFEEFIRCDKSLSGMVIPTAQIIIEGTSTALLSTIGEFNIAVLGKMNVHTDMAKVITYTALIRLVFSTAYTTDPRILAGTLEENERFMQACDRYGKQTVRDLCLSDPITKNYTKGLHVASLFRAKQVEILKPIEMMTNPIDMIMHVHHILNKLATFFAGNEGFISFDDTLTLLLALLSVSPPVNAVAISRFLMKWACVQISSLVNVAMNYYLAAVEQMQMFNKENTE